MLPDTRSSLARAYLKQPDKRLTRQKSEGKDPYINRFIEIPKGETRKRNKYKHESCLVITN